MTGAGCIRDAKGKVVMEVSELCGESKGPSRHRETWWWKDECAKVVEKKKILFDVLEESKNRGEDREKVEVNKEAYA